MKFVEELDLKGRTVFLRVDFNVPQDEKGAVRDDTRIRASLATINFILERGGRLILASHLGRPKGKANPKYSLAPATYRLAEIIPNRVVQAPDVIGPQVESLKGGLGNGEVLALENVRFYPGEEANDPGFAAELARGVDIYVNDAFGSCHRAHASVDALARLVKVKAAGYLLKREVDYLSRAVRNPDKPYVAILGGAKVEDKIPVMENLIHKADEILVGGAMAYTFFKAQGYDVGKSLVEEDKKAIALAILEKARIANVKLRLPVDHVVATAIEAGAVTQIVNGFPFPSGQIGVDIGPETISLYAEAIGRAKTIVWNGPMGVFEIDAFAAGTMKIAQAVASSKAVSIVGGGDSVAAVHKAGVADRISHISTGGGASLEYLAYETLPGIEALE
ncbi:MAG: phosphoglycerate kinase [Candidatus Aminicenantes bacterium]|jgi:phosphoglycerate kinase|nr:phosphoglycerate kinase [Candidatus Aminicenantes bacterium]